MYRFAGKRIILGVTGSIAAFKTAGWVSELVKAEASVGVIMTESACEFVAPLTYQAVCGEPVHLDMFDSATDSSMEHIDLGQEADVFIIAPATANTIARLAAGMADDLLTAVALVTKGQVIVCPAMNPAMYSHPATQENIKRLREYGYTVIEPEDGKVACGETGKGRLAEWRVVKEYILKSLLTQDLAGKNVMVTAGPTIEPIDPARFLSNRSSGKMGYCIAREAWLRGADVTLISGPTGLDVPVGVYAEHIKSANDMYEQAMHYCDDADIIIKAAAVSDFRPKTVFADKVKKDKAKLDLKLEKNKDILQAIGRKKRTGQVVVGFAAETEDFIQEAEKKRARKNLDFVAVNNIKSDNTGFSCDTNQICLVSVSGVIELPLTTKEKTATMLVQHLIDYLQ